MRLWILLLFMAASLAGGDPAGTWDCTATVPDGADRSFSMKVTKSGGSVEVTLSSDGGTFKAQDARLEGETLVFKVQVDAGSFEIRMNFKGEAMEGRWKGTDAEGKMMGKLRR